MPAKLTPTQTLISDYALKAGHDPLYYLAVAKQESNFNTFAKATDPRDLERGGSFGLFQFSLKTAQSLGFKGEPDALFFASVNLKLMAALTADNMRRLVRTKYPAAPGSKQYIEALYSLHNAGNVYHNPNAELQSHLDAVWRHYVAFRG